MTDPIQKLSLTDAADGPQGQALLIQGGGLAMRRWNEGPNDSKEDHVSTYEVLGYVLNGEATLHSGDKKIDLLPGDSWRVPAGTPHHYEIEKVFEAVEVSNPPARGEPLGAHQTAS